MPRPARCRDRHHRPRHHHHPRHSCRPGETWRREGRWCGGKSWCWTRREPLGNGARTGAARTRRSVAGNRRGHLRTTDVHRLVRGRARFEGALPRGAGAVAACHARASAGSRLSGVAAARLTIVHPARPHAPFAAVNTPSCCRNKSRCSAGVTFTMPRRPSGNRLANTRPATRKSGWPWCAPSTAPGIASADRRNCAGVIWRPAWPSRTPRRHRRPAAAVRFPRGRSSTRCRPAATA